MMKGSKSITIFCHLDIYKKIHYYVPPHSLFLDIYSFFLTYVLSFFLLWTYATNFCDLIQKIACS